MRVVTVGEVPRRKYSVSFGKYVLPNIGPDHHAFNQDATAS